MANNIQRRIEVLKSYRDDELKSSNPSIIYIKDLDDSIAQLEQLVKSGYSIVDDTKV